MLASFKRKLRDVATVARLSTEAERAARRLGTTSPGSEHYVLASLDLPDATALRAFDGLGLSKEAFAAAIDAQYLSSLGHLGIEPAEAGPTPFASEPAVAAPPRLFTAAASGQSLMQRVAAAAADRRARPLLGADVLLAVAAERHSVSARALRQLGVEPTQVEAAARREVDRWASASPSAGPPTEAP